MTFEVVYSTVLFDAYGEQELVSGKDAKKTTHFLQEILMGRYFGKQIIA